MHLACAKPMTIDSLSAGDWAASQSFLLMINGHLEDVRKVRRQDFASLGPVRLPSLNWVDTSISDRKGSSIARQLSSIIKLHMLRNGIGVVAV